MIFEKVTNIFQIINQKKYIYFLPFLFPLLISIIFFGKHSICNDIYFDADSAEISQQIGTIFGYYDFVKHPSFYFLSFIIYRLINFFIPLLSPENITLIILTIFQLFFIFSVWLLCQALKFKSNKLVFFFNLLVSFSVSTFIIFMPETYSLSVGTLLFGIWYLIFLIPKLKNLKLRLILSFLVIGFASLTSLNLIAITIPYLAIPIYIYFQNKKANSFMLSEIRYRLIEFFSSFLLGISPLIIVKVIGKGDDLGAYINRFGSFNNLLSIKQWLTSFLNFFSFGFTSPTKVIIRKYTPDLILSDFGLISLCLGIIIILITIISLLNSINFIYPRLNSFKFGLLELQRTQFILYSFLISFFQLSFFVGFAPGDSILFSPFVTTIILLSCFVYLDEIYINLKNSLPINFIIILFISLYLSINIITFSNSFKTPFPSNCRDWGVINIIIPRN